MLLSDAPVSRYYEALLAQSGYAARDGQVTLLNEVSSVFRHGGVGLIEAGTGTGKSFGYSLPGAVIGQELKKKLIISTANVSLQAQLINKDIPTIIQLIGKNIKSGVAKGKSRFICWAKVEKNLNNASCGALMRLKQDGVSLDIDNVPQEINMRDISNVKVTNCKGRSCSYFEQCEYKNNQTAVKEADIIITNHHYLLTDLSIGGGIILPKLSECLVAIDECHNLPDIAINAFSEKHFIEKSILELNNVGMFDGNGKFKSEVKLINKSIDTLNQELNEMNELLGQSNTLKKEGMIVYKDGIIPSGLFARRDKIANASKLLNDRIEYLHQSLDDEMSENDNPDIDRLYTHINKGLLENKKIQKVWNLFSEYEEGEAPVAKWFRNDEKNNDYEAGASIISASKSLKKALIESGAHLILTSATISENQSFSAFKKECGIDGEVKEAICKSPFSYKENARLIVPAMKSDPSNVGIHTEELIEAIPKIIKAKEGSLVLFLNKDQMVKVRDGLIGKIDAEILVQGELSKKEIIDRHCANVDSGLSSVIFGLDSFFEGIDLQGKYCSTVGISKIPFPAMNDPVSIARKHYIELNGGNAFNEIIMPFVIKKLVQGVGRLIRTMNDYGDVYIFDTRMATKAYGKTILNNLPDMERQILVNI